MKGARHALTTAPESEPMLRPKPSLHLDASDVDGSDDWQVGDTVRLAVTGKVTSVSQEEYGDDKETHTNIALRLLKIVRKGASSQDETPGASDAEE